MNLNQLVSDFSIPNEKGESVSLFSTPNKWAVLFFYPKDMTPGCTVQGKDFSQLQSEFERLDVKIYGISADDVASHTNFCQKESLTITLLSDVDKTVCKQFGVWQKKTVFGKESEGIDRTTFLISISEKKIVKVWENVQAQDHAKAVLDFAKQNCK